jgi:hypothetical protein
VLLALLLVLLAQSDNLAKDLGIEAVALGFLIDFPLAFVELADLLFDVLDAFDDCAQLITRNLNWSVSDALAPLGSGLI